MTETREKADVNAIVAEIIAEQFDEFREAMERHIDKRIAAKALPPFAPPAPWSAGLHGAASLVRHRNGVWSARRDTEGEPGADDAWLPLLVGVRSIEFINSEDTGALTIIVNLSDGSAASADIGTVDVAAPAFALDDDGTMTEGGRDIGSVKPLIADLLRRLMAKESLDD